MSCFERDKRARELFVAIHANTVYVYAADSRV